MNLNLLVIRLSAMGDIALLKPALLMLIKSNSNVRIDLLIEPRFAPIFKDIPEINVLKINVKKEYSTPIRLLKLSRILAKNKYDAIIDQHFVTRTRILCLGFRLLGIPTYHIKKNRTERKKLTQKENKINKPLKHTVQKYVDTFEKAGFSISWNLNCIQDFISKKEVKKFTHQKNRKQIGIAPFAQHKGKIYPIKKMKSVVKTLSKNYDILLFGFGKKEETVFLDWEKINPNTIHSLIGKFSFKEELKLIQNLDVMISMDSGNMHLASNYNVAVVSIWGATHTNTGFYGFNQPKENCVERTDLDCRPCSIYGNKPCFKDTWDCLEITPTEIIKKCEMILREF